MRFLIEKKKITKRVGRSVLLLLCRDMAVLEAFHFNYSL